MTYALDAASDTDYDNISVITFNPGIGAQLYPLYYGNILAGWRQSTQTGIYAMPDRDIDNALSTVLASYLEEDKEYKTRD